MTRTTLLTTIGIAVLSAIGVVGCSRTEVGAGPTPISNPPIASYADQAADLPSYANARPPVRTISTPHAQIEVEPYEERRTVSHADRRTRTKARQRRVTRNRPFSHSVAIVGGSAGAGALIGALAGGGKGAGIGALAGGGAGLVYDRLTHKRKE